MTFMKRLLAIGLTSLTLAVTMAPSAEAQYRGRGFRPGVGVRGPVVRGPAYGYRGYRGPRYAHRGWRGGHAAGAVAAGVLGAAVLGSVIAAQPQCYRELAGYDRRGRPFYRDICN